MALTVNLTQLKRKKRKDGTIPIYIRLTENRKSKYISTGISVEPQFWNSNKQKVRRSHRKYKFLNKKLGRLKNEVEEKKYELEDKEKLNINTLKTEVKEDDYNSLLKVAERYHSSLEGTERHHEWKKFGVVLNNLRAFMEGQTVDVNNVDASFIEDFQEYLLTKVNYDKEKEEYYGNKPNTVRRKLTSLKGMYIRLLKDGTVSHDPFLRVEKVEPNKVEKTRLTPEQIDNIKGLDLSEGSGLWHTRNYFLYSFYNAGIRFGDICCLQWSNIVDDRLKYRMMKTGGLKSIKQLDSMKAILDLYKDESKKEDDLIFPIIDRLYKDPAKLRRKIGVKNVKINDHLKQIAKKANIDASLSFHVSRHSFANYALKKGMDLYSISKALGHKDLETTQEYLDTFDEELLDKSMGKLFD